MKGVTWLLAVLLIALVCANQDAGKDPFSVTSSGDEAIFKCPDGKWQDSEGNVKNETMTLNVYEDENSFYTCKDSQLYVRIRTCDNCIELNAETFSIIIVSNVVMTLLLGVVVYYDLLSQKANGSSLATKLQINRY